MFVKNMKVAFLGQIVPTKGVTELVTACTGIMNTELILVGPVKTTYKKELMEIALTKNNGDWLIFTGEIRRKKALRQISNADIFALPSYREAFPLSILEAMALSKPIIATDVGAISEILNINGLEQCGICVKTKDVEDLRMAVTKVLNDNNLRIQMGRCSRNRVEKLYSSEKVFPRLIVHWSELIV